MPGIEVREIARSFRLGARRNGSARRSLPRVGWPTLALVSVLALTPGANSAQQPPGVSPNSVQTCRQLGEWVHQRFPSVCDRRVHWVLGVDISGSMTGKLDTLKAVLREWGKYVLTGQDRITLVTADAGVEVYGPWDASGDPELLMSRVLDKVSFRPEFQHDSQVLAGRSRVLEAAAAAARAPGYQVVSMFLGDRNDANNGLSAQFGAAENTRRYGSLLSAGETAPSGAGVVEVEQQFPTQVRPGHNFDLIVLLSGARAAGPRAAAEAQNRRVPVDPPDIRTDPPGVDAFAETRWVLQFGFLAFLLPGIVLVWAVLRGKGGTLSNDEVTTGVWMTGRQQPPLSVSASRNATGFRLDPAREGLGDPVVLKVHVLGVPSFKPWRAVLKATDGHRVKTDDPEHPGWHDEVPLTGSARHEVRVEDARGLVARGSVRFRENRTLRYCWVAGVCLVALGFLGWAGRSFALAGLPPVPQSTTVEITEVPLCQ